jgi:hypothetical protein
MPVAEAGDRNRSGPHPRYTADTLLGAGISVERLTSRLQRQSVAR